MIRPIATIAAWLGGPLGLIVVILTVAGILRPWEGVVCLLGCAAWSFGAGIVLARDLRRLGGIADAAIRAAIEAERRGRQAIATGADSSQMLLDRLPDALFQLDGAPGARRIIWRNPAAAHAYGAEESALLRHPALRAALAEAETGDQPIRISLALAAPIPRDLDAIVIRAGARDQTAPLYLLLADRTRERGLDRRRADFVANASHELRTPLTSLIGFIETLRGPALDDAEALPRFLAIMAEQADRMQRIIADLLSLSRIEMTEHQPPTEAIDLAALLRQVAGFMAPLLREAGMTLTLDIPPDLPKLRGDSGQLTQVFGNLIENSIKYGAIKYGAIKHGSKSPDGGPIRVGVATTPDVTFAQPGLVVSVADDGPGIPREHLPRLTERFYRVEKGRTRTLGGTGLGLAIVKHVVSRHRGRLVIDSIEGVGTTCLVWLPLASEPARGLQDGQMTVARKG